MNRENAYKLLSSIGQEHVLRYFDELSEDQQKILLSQIEETDFSVLSRLSETQTDLKGTFSPLEAMQYTEIEKRKEEFYDVGIKTLKEGKVAALLLAGGMGTRLGADGPKGVYDIGITKPLYIFECLINNLMKVVKETGRWIHLFVMTSEKNHDATVQFFKEKDYFGYNEEMVTFFKQDMAPACDFNGKLYMEEKESRIGKKAN